MAFGHTGVGTLVGLYGYHAFQGQSPAVGLAATAAAGVVSHYLTDFIPHGHFIKFKDFRKKIGLEIVFNLFASIALIQFLVFYQDRFGLEFWYVLFGIGGAQLPDVLDGLIYINVLPKKGLLKAENALHTLTHWHGAHEKGLPWGSRDLWQIAVFLLALTVILA